MSTKIFIGTPTIDQKVNVGYLYTVFNMNSLLPEIETSLFIVGGNSLITDARNRIFSVFTSNKEDYLLFLDSDVEVPVEAIKKIVSFKKDIVGIPISKKNFINPTPNIGNALSKIDKDGLMEVDGMSTAIMLISRKVVETFIKDADVYTESVNDLINTTNINQPKIYDVFKAFSENGKYWCEDYYFCHQARTKYGFKIYAYMNTVTNHYGTVPYTYKF